MVSHSRNKILPQNKMTAALSARAEAEAGRSARSCLGGECTLALFMSSDRTFSQHNLSLFPMCSFGQMNLNRDLFRYFYFLSTLTCFLLHLYLDSGLR